MKTSDKSSSLNQKFNIIIKEHKNCSHILSKYVSGMNMKYVGDLIRRGEKYMRNHPKVRQEGLEVIQKFLSSINLSFKDDVKDWQRPVKRDW